MLGRFEAVLHTARERIKWNALYDLVRGGGRGGQTSGSQQKGGGRVGGRGQLGLICGQRTAQPGRGLGCRLSRVMFTICTC